jgi:hypothetical protein
MPSSSSPAEEAVAANDHLGEVPPKPKPSSKRRTKRPDDRLRNQQPNQQQSQPRSQLLHSHDLVALADKVRLINVDYEKKKKALVLDSTIEIQYFVLTILRKTQ